MEKKPAEKRANRESGTEDLCVAARRVHSAGRGGDRNQTTQREKERESEIG